MSKLKPRQFGDDMGKESEITHIPTILMAMYSTIALYSIGVGQLTGSPWWYQVAFYFVDLLVFYVWHYAAHQTWSGQMNKLHMDHHLRVNPVSRFFSSDELNQKKYGQTDFSSVRKSLIVFSPFLSSHIGGGLQHEGFLFAGNFAVLGFAALLGVSSRDLFAAFVMAGVMGVLGAGLHSSFHIRSFVLSKYAWYRELRALHFMHHMGDQNSNLAVLNLGVDRLFGSLTIQDPLRKKKKHDDEDNNDNSNKDQELLVSKSTLLKICANGKLASALLFNVNGNVLSDEEFERLRAVHTGWPSTLSRIVVFVIALYAWFALEPLMTARANDSSFADFGHVAFEPLRQYLISHNLVGVACTASALLSELSAWTLVLCSLFGPTTKPLVTGATAFLMRLIILAVNPGVPTPTSAIWNASQQVQLLSAVAGASTFLCVRVITASTFFLMVWRFKWWTSGRRVAIRIASGIVLAFQVAMTLAMQTNWSSDVLFAVAVAFGASHFARHGARWLDHGLP
jgi:hypothetical protein